MIPIENSVAGPRRRYPPPAAELGLHIVGEHFLPIQHPAAGGAGRHARRTSRSVHSHIQALGQCRKIIRKLGLQAGRRADTAGSARHRRRARRSDAARRSPARSPPRSTASRSCSEDVEDEEHNTTRFVVLSRDPNGAEPGNGPVDDDLHLPRAQRAGGALQGDGRLRHQRRQHDQARELPARRQVLRHPVLRRHRGHPDDPPLQAARWRSWRSSPASSGSSASIRQARSARTSRAGGNGYGRKRIPRTCETLLGWQAGSRRHTTSPIRPTPRTP